MNNSIEIADIKRLLNIADVAERYGCKVESRKNGDALLLDCVGGKLEKNASLSVFSSGKAFKLHSGDAQGDVFNFIQYKEGCDFRRALEIAADLAGVQLPKPGSDNTAPRKDKGLHEHIADACLAAAHEPALLEYLTGRGITQEAVQRSVLCKNLGFNTYISKARKPGEKSYGGPAAAFIVRNRMGRVAAVDMRFLDPALNGGLKTQCQGNKDGVFWMTDYNALKTSHTVVIVESSINALSVESAGMRGVAGLAVLGVGNIGSIDFSFLRGKKVIIAFDKDMPSKNGHGHWKAPGQQAAWTLYDVLTDLGISAFLVDHDKWSHATPITDAQVNTYLEQHPDESARIQKAPDHAQQGLRNRIAERLRTHGLDLNDLLQQRGAEGVREALRTLEPWLIPGVQGNPGERKVVRVRLPEVDAGDYWRFRSSQEHTWYLKTTMVSEKDDTGAPVKDENGREQKEEKEVPQDVCGFRIAGLRRVSISGYVAATSGTRDDAPETFYVAQVQTRKDGPHLVKKVFKDGLYDPKQWEKHFGAVYNGLLFKRAVTTLENTAVLNEIRTTNMVGLSWLDEKLIATEGPECFFADPVKQCGSYRNLTFHSGHVHDAVDCLNTWHGVYKSSQAVTMLVWQVGTHLKLFTNFYPHLLLGGPKGTGKSTLMEMLGISAPLSKLALSEANDYRLRIASSWTSFPIAVDELTNAAMKKRKVLSDAMQNLYTKAPMVAGADALLYLQFSPVMVGGEELADMDNVLSKTVRCTLTLADRGNLPDIGKIPRWPMKQWLAFLCGLDRTAVDSLYKQAHADMQAKATAQDATSERMVKNYAVLLLSWRLVCEFTGLPTSTFGMEGVLIREMNGHINTTEADREPWVKILEAVANSIARKQYPYPAEVQIVEAAARGRDGQPLRAQCLVIKPGEIMDYIANDQGMREFRDKMPISSKAALMEQLKDKNMIFRHPIHPWIGGGEDGKKHRLTNYIAIPLFGLAQYGITIAGGDYESPELRDFVDGMDTGAITERSNETW